MKKTDSITKRHYFRQKSNFLTTQQMLHRVVAICLLAFVCSGAWAEDYVIYDNGHFFAHGTNTTITAPTTFSATSCIWTTSGSTYLKNGSYGINLLAELKTA